MGKKQAYPFIRQVRLNASSIKSETKLIWWWFNAGYKITR